jgi:UPF0716 protein FxsA
MRFFAIFAIIAIAEMATFFWVESRIGLGWALLLALTTALLGSILVKRAGVSVFGRFTGKLNNAQMPGRELVDGAAILVAGAFLISPGFITDSLGFLLLFPPVRDLIYRIVSKRLSGRVSVFTSGGQRASTGRPPTGTEDIIDVEGYEVDYQPESLNDEY